MKKTILVFSLLSYSLISRAQWTTNGSGDAVNNNSSGKVGIGTTSPRGQFDVAGTGDVYLANNPIAGTTQTIYLPGHLFLAPYNGSDWTYLQARRSDNSGSTNLLFRTWNAGAMMQPMAILSNGSVGIGTTTPRGPLEVRSVGNNTTVQTGLILQQYNPGVPNNSAGISLDFGIGNNDANNNIEGRITLKETWFAAKPKMFFSLWDANNTMQDRMVIDYTGNVGIGTTLPDAMLAVKGQVHSNEVKVDLNVPGPDYVFEKDYKLTSLEEIKNYIDQNKHLPEVPSAKDMEKNGVQLGEMNILLLKKIEELTLYVIEQNKRIDNQQKEIGELKTFIRK